MASGICCPSKETSFSLCWIKNGQLLVDVLKEEIGQCAKKFSIDNESSQREGADLLYEIIIQIWSLETGQLSRLAADIACDEIRYAVQWITMYSLATPLFFEKPG